MTKKENKLIWHLTSIKNLRNIFKNGLLPRNKCNEFIKIDVADKDILDRRSYLNEYIPFHFIHDTPFAGAVQKAYPNNSFVFITLWRDYVKKNGFKIVPKHPAHDSKIFDYEEGFEKVNWDLFDGYRDYQDKSIKINIAAECITNITIDASDFAYIFVKNENIKNEAMGIGGEMVVEKVKIDSTKFV